MPASLTDDQVKLRDPNHEVDEEKRKSARKKEWVLLLYFKSADHPEMILPWTDSVPVPCNICIAPKVSHILPQNQ